MAEYIERETMALKVKRYLMPNVDDSGMVQVEDAERYFLKLLEEQPAADVVEVRHGEWRKEIRPKKSDDGLFYWNAHPRVVYVCSVCGRDEPKKEPYCNCGAKMDKKENDNG